MLIRQAELHAILEGTIDLAFRRWTAARILNGTRLRTAIGLVEVTSLDETTIDAITKSDAMRAGFASLDEFVSVLGQHPERPVFRFGLRYAGPDPRIALSEDPELSDDDRAGLTARLDRLRPGLSPRRLDGRRPRDHRPPPSRPRRRSRFELGLETLVFKRDVRKLKELGLTESLEVGYRLSPRGKAFMSFD